MTRFDGETWIRYAAAHSLIDNEITALVLSPDGGIWVGSINGIAYFSALD